MEEGKVEDEKEVPTWHDFVPLMVCWKREIEVCD
jgi:hypothetical protein